MSVFPNVFDYVKSATAAHWWHWLAVIVWNLQELIYAAGWFCNMFHIVDRWQSLSHWFEEWLCISYNGNIYLCYVNFREKYDNHTLSKKVKWSPYRTDVAQRVGRGIVLLFHDRGTGRGWVVSSTPRLHFTPGKTWYPFYRRLGGPQGRSGQAENLIPTGIRSQTIQPIVSRYTDWATWPTS